MKTPYDLPPDDILPEKPLSAKLLAAMDGMPVRAELAGGRSGYGIVAVEERGAKIYIRLRNESVLAYHDGQPNELLDPKIYSVL